MATHSSIFACKIPWTEEPGRLSPWGRKESDTTERIHFTSLHFTSLHFQPEFITLLLLKFLRIPLHTHTQKYQFYYSLKKRCIDR